MKMTFEYCGGEMTIDNEDTACGNVWLNVTDECEDSASMVINLDHLEAAVLAFRMLDMDEE